MLEAPQEISFFTDEASEISNDITNFNHLLTPAEDTAQKAFDRIDDRTFDRTAGDTAASITVNDLTVSLLVATNASKKLVSVADLTAWVSGTANQVIVTDDFDGTITLATPQGIAAGSSPTFVGLTLSGLTASRLVGTSAGSVLQSEDLFSWVTGTANRVTVADDFDGTITLSGPQDIDATASPTFVGLTLSGAIATPTSITMAEDAWIGITGPAERLVFNGSDDTIAFMNTKVGIGTLTSSHGGVGGSMLAIDGANASIDGPHIQLTTDSDDYPLFSLVMYTHDAVTMLWDAYWNGTSYYSSDAGSNFQIQKVSNTLKFAAESGIAQGAVATFVTAFYIEADGEIMHAPGSALKTYWRDAAISIHSANDSFLDLTADGGTRINTGDLQLQAGVSLDFGIQAPGINTIHNYWSGAGFSAGWPFYASTIYDASFTDHYITFSKKLTGGTRAAATFTGNVGTGIRGTPSGALGAGVGALEIFHTVTGAGVSPTVVAAFTSGLSYFNGDVGIGTISVPHGGIGAAKLAIEGANASVLGPHVQFTTASNDYPLLQILPWQHDNIQMLFDANFNGTNIISSDAGSNFMFRKNADRFTFNAESGIAAGSNITWVESFRIEADGEIMHAPGSALKTYWRDVGLSIHSGGDSFLDFTADGEFRFYTSAVRLVPGLLTASVDLSITTDADEIDFHKAKGATAYVGIGQDSAASSYFRIFDGANVDIQFFNRGVSYINTGSGLGLGTITAPHGGIGQALLALEGTATGDSSPIIQFTIGSVGDYPVLTIAPLGQTTGVIAWDAYYDSGWKSSVAGASVWAMVNNGGNGTWDFNGDLPASAADAVSWTTVYSIDSSYEMTYSPAAARWFYVRDAAIGFASLNDGYMDVKADLGVRIGAAGGVTNYSMFEADGTLAFHGAAVVWDDINFGAGTSQQPAASIPVTTTFTDNLGADTDIATKGFAVGDKLSWVTEYVHKCKTNGDIYFHVHFQCDAAPTGTDYVKWQADYTITRDGATCAPITPITVETAVDTQYEQLRSDTAVISGSGIQIGDQIKVTLRRVVAAGDAYTGLAKLCTFGLHIEVDTVGSRTTYTK